LATALPFFLVAATTSWEEGRPNARGLSAPEPTVQTGRTSRTDCLAALSNSVLEEEDEREEE